MAADQDMEETQGTDTWEEETQTSSLMEPGDLLSGAFSGAKSRVLTYTALMLLGSVVVTMAFVLVYALAFGVFGLIQGMDQIQKIFVDFSQILKFINDPINSLVMTGLSFFSFLVTLRLSYWFYQAVILVSMEENLNVITALKNAKHRGWGMVGLNFIITLAAGLASLFFIIPGIIVGVIFSQANHVYVGEGAGVFDALSRSRQLVKGRFLGVFGRLLFIFFIAFLVMLIPFFGWLFAPPIIFMGMALLYKDLGGGTQGMKSPGNADNDEKFEATPLSVKVVDDGVPALSKAAPAAVAVATGTEPPPATAADTKAAEAAAQETAQSFFGDDFEPPTAEEVAAAKEAFGGDEDDLDLDSVTGAQSSGSGIPKKILMTLLFLIALGAGLFYSGLLDTYLYKGSGSKNKIQNAKPAGNPNLVPPPYVAAWPRGFGQITSLIVDYAGNVFVADANRKIHKLDYEGNKIGMLADPEPAKLTAAVWDMAADEHSNLYVSMGGLKVIKYDAAGNFVKEWSSQGPEPQKGVSYQSETNFLACDYTGHIYTADHPNARVNVFDYEGEFLYRFQALDEEGVRLESIDGMTVFHDGNLYLSDAKNNKVHRYSIKGERRSLIKLDSETEGFIPANLALDWDGNLYIQDKSDWSVVKIDPAGAVEDIRANQPPQPLELTQDICIDPWNGLYVAENKFRRIVVKR